MSGLRHMCFTIIFFWTKKNGTFQSRDFVTLCFREANYSFSYTKFEDPDYIPPKFAESFGIQIAGELFLDLFRVLALWPLIITSAWWVSFVF